MNTEITDTSVETRTRSALSAPKKTPIFEEIRYAPILQWLPLIIFPATSLLVRRTVPAWVFMWLMALGIFFGCKWLTLSRFLRTGAEPSLWRALAYLFSWPGMDAAAFCQGRGTPQTRQFRPHFKELFRAAALSGLGAVIVWFAAQNTFGAAPLFRGWLGMVGLVWFLHFGLFHLLALFWENAGINVQPVMRKPLSATSLAEFWSKRWNTAFNVLAHELAFSPLARRYGVRCATLAVFLISGLVHEAVISLPSGGGFGLPTGYFLLQGIGVLIERGKWARRAGLGRGLRGWLFTMAFTAIPVFWLFHPPFVHNVILPMLKFIGANSKELT